MFDFPQSPAAGTEVSNGSSLYRYDGTKWAAVGGNTAYVAKAGDTMTGPLTLPGNAVLALQAIPFQQMQSAITAAPFVKLAGDTMSGGIIFRYAYPSITFDATGANQGRGLYGNLNGVTHWGLHVGDGTASDDFAIHRYSDTGAYVDTPLIVQRGSGRLNTYNGATIWGGDHFSLEGGNSYGIIRYNNNYRRWWVGVDPNDGPGHWNVFDDTAGRTVLKCQIDGNVYAPLGLYTNYFKSYGYVDADKIYTHGGRIVSQYPGGNPSVAVHRMGLYAGGIWCEDSGRLAFGWCNGDGTPTAAKMVLDRGNYFQVFGAAYADYIQSSGDIRASNNVYAQGGIFGVADGVWIQRNGSNGDWNFVENGTVNFTAGGNGDTSARETAYANRFFSRNNVYFSNTWEAWLGYGGSGRVLQFSTSWLWDWNWSSGSLYWNRAGGWGAAFYSDAGFAIASSWAGKPGGGSWADTSDARIKDVTGAYTSGLAELIQLRPVRYRYKGNDRLISEPIDRKRKFDRRTDVSASLHEAVLGRDFVGLVAQDAETAMPEMVERRRGMIGDEEVDDLRTLDTTPLIYATINALREIDARLRKLEGVA